MMQQSALLTSNPLPMARSSPRQDMLALHNDINPARQMEREKGTPNMKGNHIILPILTKRILLLIEPPK